MIPPSTDELRDQWLDRGFRIELHTDPPGKEWQQVVQGVDALFMLLDGSVEVTTAGLGRIAEPGEEVVLPSGTVHTMRNTGQTDAHWAIGYRVGLGTPHDIAE